MTAEILQGDVIETLRGLPDESVHCCVTSPPYWGLRDYGTAQWQGGDPNCDHKGSDRYYTMRGASSASSEAFSEAGPDNAERLKKARWREAGDCACGARHVDVQIGLEPTPEEHIARMVEVFAEVKRVLRRDGCLFLNYGDCYASAPNGRPAAEVVGDDRTFRDKPFSTVTSNSDHTSSLHRKGFRNSDRYSGQASVAAACFKPKDLCGMPWRVAFALQADGWWLRSAMPWVKRSAMPESCTDRPSTALEYVFVLAKSERYYFDADAVRRPHSESGLDRYRHGYNQFSGGSKVTGMRTRGDSSANLSPNPNGRNLRNSDFYFDSLDLAIEQAKAQLAHLTHLRERGGLLLSEEGEPLALDANTEASTVEHFAAYPRKLVQPLIQAGTSERGCCSDCGSPWVRVTEKTEVQKPKQSGKPWLNRESQRPDGYKPTGLLKETVGVSQTLGWRKSCKCVTDQSQPCTVLDPFAGTGTTLFVAMELGRRAIGIELNEKYVGMMRRRLRRAQLPLELVD